MWASNMGATQALRLPLLIAVLTALLCGLSASAADTARRSQDHGKASARSLREAHAGKRRVEDNLDSDEDDEEYADDDEEDVDGSLMQTDAEADMEDEGLDYADEDEEAYENEAHSSHGKVKLVAKKHQDAEPTAEPTARDSGKMLALSDDGSVHHVDEEEYKSKRGTNFGTQHKKPELAARISETLNMVGKRVGVDEEGNVRHEYQDFAKTEWYPVTKEISSKLPSEIQGLKKALHDQHKSAEAAYEESVKYRNLIRDLTSELTHYQEGEHKFRDEVFEREDKRSEEIKKKLHFDPSTGSAENTFNEVARDTQRQQDNYMNYAMSREADDEETQEAEKSSKGGSLLQESEAEESEEADYREGRGQAKHHGRSARNVREHSHRAKYDDGAGPDAEVDGSDTD